LSGFVILCSDINSIFYCWFQNFLIGCFLGFAKHALIIINFADHLLF